MNTQYNLVVAILEEFVEKVRLFENRWNEPEARHVDAWDLVLQNLKEEKLTGRCIPFAKLQPSLLLYIQKSFGEDVEGMLSKPDNNGNYRSPSRVCVALMRELGVEKGVLTRRSRSIFSQLYRDPMDEELTSVAVQCGVCNAQRTDKHPTYECTMGRYVARRLVRSDCRNTWHKPVDASIDFITYKDLTEHVVEIIEQDVQGELEGHHPNQGKGVLMRRSRSNFSHLYRDPMHEEPTSVAVQCGVCNAQRTDKHPTYDCTMGRYVARRLVCNDCRNTWHKPVDASIDFITYIDLIKHVVGVTEQDAQDSENVEAIEDDQDSLAGDYDWNDRDVQADGSLEDITSLDWL